jgi:predicted DsbA family dithiol-disulfide isomerase
MTVKVRYHTDPACPWSWAAEPAVRKLMVEFGDSLSWTYVMGGFARDFTKWHEDPAAAGVGGTDPVYPRLARFWLDVAATSGMPLDPRLWSEGPIGSSYPACMAVKAAADQGPAAAERYLRGLREGLMCFRRKLDTTEALVEEARRAGLNVERFRIDLASNATVEGFGNDLEEHRGAGLELPSLVFVAEDGARQVVSGFQPAAEPYREAALAAGASAVAGGSAPSVPDALRRFGRMAGREVEVVCGLPGPRAAAELWRLATEWQVKPTRVLTGELWEAA